MALKDNFLSVKEYPLEEEDCILVHGLLDSIDILNSKENLIRRISNYQYTFNNSHSLSMKIDKTLSIVYNNTSNLFRLLIDRIFKVEKKLKNIS